MIEHQKSIKRSPTIQTKMIPFISQVLYRKDASQVDENFLSSIEKHMYFTNKKDEIYSKAITQSKSDALPLPSVCEHITQPVSNTNANTTNIQEEIKDKMVEPFVSPKKSTELFTPTQENTLFWSVFIGIYGYNDYMRIGNKYNNEEINEKQQIMEELSKTPKRVKETNHKMTNANVQELFSSLMVNKKDDLFSLVAFSVYYKTNIYVLFPNHTYLEYLYNGHDDTNEEENCEKNKKHIVIHCRKGNRGNIYSIDLMPKCVEDIKQIENSTVRLESYAKPLRGVSSFKQTELEMMAKKMEMEPSVLALKKGDLYVKLLEKCSEFVAV